MTPRTIVSALVALSLAGLATAGPYKTGCPGTIEECTKHLAASLGEKGWLGVELAPREDGGMTVTTVVPASPAEAAGLVAGDVLLGLEGTRFGTSSEAEMKQAQAAVKPGRTVTYLIERGGKEQKLGVKLGSMPESVQMQVIGRHALDHVQGAEAKTSALTERSVQDVAALVKSGQAVLLDANGAETRDKHGVVQGARLLTSFATYDVAQELPADKAATLVFYCANERCTASDAAAARAQAAGYTNVSIMRAGIMGWKKSGQRTVTPGRS